MTEAVSRRPTVDWLQASIRITRYLLTRQDRESLALIARETREVADADIVTLVLPDADRGRLVVEVADGERSEEFTGLSYAFEGTLAAQAIDTGRPILVPDVTVDSAPVHLSTLLAVGPVMVLPLVGARRARGALVVGRLQSRPCFDETDLDMATTFANHAAVALELADARADQERVLLLEDRDRIARDLHDHVIQRLFAAGLGVQSVAAAMSGDTGPEQIARSERLERVVADIDDTIRQIRSSIFQLRGQLGSGDGSARKRLLSVVADVTPLVGFDPHVRFDGPIDSVVPEPIADDLVALVREALTNAARHARAETIEVSVVIDGDDLLVDVTDDGIGVGGAGRRSGLDNLRRRAEDRGGRFDLFAAPEGFGAGVRTGTWLHWQIPLVRPNERP